VAVDTRRYLFVELSTAWQKEEVKKKAKEQAERKAKKDVEKRAKWEEEKQNRQRRSGQGKRRVAQGQKCERYYKGRGETCKG